MVSKMETNSVTSLTIPVVSTVKKLLATTVIGVPVILYAMTVLSQETKHVMALLIAAKTAIS